MLVFVEGRASYLLDGLIPIAGAVADETQLPYYVLDLDRDPLANRIRGLPDDQLSRNELVQSVVMLMDHCTTGAAGKAGVNTVLTAGGRVTHLLAYSITAQYFDWSAFAEMGVSVHNFFTVH